MVQGQICRKVNLKNPFWASKKARRHTSELSTLTLKPRADVTRSPKKGHWWPHEKDLCPTKKSLKRKNKHVGPDLRSLNIILTATTGAESPKFSHTDRPIWIVESRSRGIKG